MKLRGHPRFYELLDEMRRLHDAKAADYSPDEPLENLRVSAEWAGIEPWRGVLVRMGDKWMRLVNLCRRGGQHEVPDETVKDTALDLANYSLLFIVLWEKSRGSREASHPQECREPRVRASALGLALARDEPKRRGDC